MKTNPRSGRAAFSLIELMTVIAIIVILAGLVIGGMGYAQDLQAKKKALVQIHLMSKALEEYKLDNGSYPATADSKAKDTFNSSILFTALYYEGELAPKQTPPGTQKIYIPELEPANNKQGWTSGTASTSTKIMDPWGVEYRYRSARNSSPPDPTDPTKNVNTYTWNPDFDLWSSGKDGKTSDDLTDPSVRDDIKN